MSGGTISPGPGVAAQMSIVTGVTRIVTLKLLPSTRNSARRVISSSDAVGRDWCAFERAAIVDGVPTI